MVGIKEGVGGANKKMKDNYFVMMLNDKIDFDIALTVSEKSGAQGKAKIGVAAIAVAGGDIAIENQSARISRIKFSVKSGCNGLGSVVQRNQ